MSDLKGIKHWGSTLQTHLVFCSFSFKQKFFIQSKAQTYTGARNGSHSFGMYVNRGAMGSNLQINDLQSPRGLGIFLEQLKRRFQCDKLMLSLDI